MHIDRGCFSNQWLLYLYSWCADNQAHNISYWMDQWAFIVPFMNSKFSFCKRINLIWSNVLIFFLISGRIEQAKQSKGPSGLEDSCQRMMQVLSSLTQFLQDHPHLIQVAARDIANSIAHIYIGKWQKIPWKSIAFQREHSFSLLWIWYIQ